MPLFFLIRISAVSGLVRFIVSSVATAADVLIKLTGNRNGFLQRTVVSGNGCRKWKWMVWKAFISSADFPLPYNNM